MFSNLIHLTMKTLSASAISALYFIVVISIAILVTSCGTGHVSCDAYGQVDNESTEIEKT
jgi:hypothetical protein